MHPGKTFRVLSNSNVLHGKIDVSDFIVQRALLVYTKKKCTRSTEYRQNNPEINNLRIIITSNSQPRPDRHSPASVPFLLSGRHTPNAYQSCISTPPNNQQRPTAQSSHKANMERAMPASLTNAQTEHHPVNQSTGTLPSVSFGRTQCFGFFLVPVAPAPPASLFL